MYPSLNIRVIKIEEDEMGDMWHTSERREMHTGHG
jgi:hypothetical protein